MVSPEAPPQIRRTRDPLETRPAFALGLVLAGLGLVTWLTLRDIRVEPAPTVAAPPPAPSPAPVVPVASPPPAVPAEVAEPEPDPAQLEREAAAIAEAEREAQRAADERRAAEERRLRALAEAEEARKASESEPAMPPDPGVLDRLREQIASTTSRLGAAREEHSTLREAIEQLRSAPKPRKGLSIDQSPVAQTVHGKEIHFEVRGDRVTFVDLDGLLKRVEDDARLRLRMVDSSRPITAQVGPVGAYAVKYQLGRTLPDVLGEIAGPRGMTVSLLGFELVPMSNLRGETWDITRRPMSEYARVLNRTSPRTTAVTMWVYPDGFALFRQLRDDLHARGFIVAARPLPQDVPIRGSPNGSRSSAQ